MCSRAFDELHEEVHFADLTLKTGCMHSPDVCWPAAFLGVSASAQSVPCMTSQLASKLVLCRRLLSVSVCTVRNV